MKRWMIVLAAIIGGTVIAAGLAVLMARPAQAHPWIREGDPEVLVIAHQGGNHLWPDNTLLAFENAAELGVDVLEMDIHSTADGALVVIHDDTVDRTTDGSGRVNDLTLEEIQALDAAYHWTPLNPDGTPIDPDDHPYRGQGITIPTLREVFEAHPDIRMTVEIKQVEPSIAAPLCDLIEEYGRQDDILVASFDVGALVEFRRECPGVATSTHQNEVIVLYALTRLYMGPAFTPGQPIALQIPEERAGLRVVSPRFTSAAQSRNLAVQVWTINREEDMRRLIDWGVDGLITDQPGLALEILGRGE